MRTKNLMMAMATFAMAGCSQNEVTDVNPDTHPAVGFDVYTGVPTRGAETTTATLKDNTKGNFGILAFYTGASNWETAKTTTQPNFMYNEKVHYDASATSWAYDNIKYWPSNLNHMISFFAYAPYEAAPAAGTNKGIVLSGKTDKGIPFIDFTLKDATKLTEMVDLVVADQHDQKYSENSGTVNFKFGHILSKVLFKVKLKNALSGNTRIFVKKLEILGTTNNGTSKFYTKAEYKNQHWQYDAANIPATDFDVANIMNVAAVSGVGDYTKTAIEATTSAKSLFKDGEFLFLIPVNDSETPGVETGTTANGEIKVRLTYDAITPDVNDPTNKYLVSETEALVDLPSGALKLGTAYTYTFNLALNPVQVTVDDAITDWKDGTSGDTGDI